MLTTAGDTRWTSGCRLGRATVMCCCTSLVMFLPLSAVWAKAVPGGASSSAAAAAASQSRRREEASGKVSWPNGMGISDMGQIARPRLGAA
jgi:hypothetical protein